MSRKMESGADWYYMIWKMSQDRRMPIFTDGETILCHTKTLCETMLKVLEAVSDFDLVSGYYDPEEDARNGETNEYTGLWYIDLNG